METKGDEFLLYEPVQHCTKGKGRITGLKIDSVNEPWTVELESGGFCAAATKDLTSLGPPPEPTKPKLRPEGLQNGPVEFKDGDQVPDWVWVSSIPELQKEARFLCDVKVFWNGRVIVEQKEATFPPMYELIGVSEKGSVAQWAGYPTEFRPKLKEGGSEGVNDSSGD